MCGWFFGAWIFPLLFMAMCFFGWAFWQPRHRESHEVRDLREEMRILRDEMKNLKR